MKKIITLILFGLLFINVQAMCEEQTDAVKNQETVPATTSENTNVNNNFGFNDDSFTITDEQFQEAKNIANEEEEKPTLETRIINSSHFTVGTPSKTYVPLKKNIQ